MNKHIIEKFILLWKKYFDGAELPVIFYYTNEEGHARLVEPDSVPGCVIGILSEARRGRPLCLNADSVGCPGANDTLALQKGLCQTLNTSSPTESLVS